MRSFLPQGPPGHGGSMSSPFFSSRSASGFLRGAAAFIAYEECRHLLITPERFFFRKVLLLHPKIPAGLHCRIVRFFPHVAERVVRRKISGCCKGPHPASTAAEPPVPAPPARAGQRHRPFPEPGRARGLLHRPRVLTTVVPSHSPPGTQGTVRTGRGTRFPAGRCLPPGHRRCTRLLKKR